ncbi:Rho termination factor N-terminal domain-containing protein, partial [Klebsiella pneumoniae]|uniref:Rho termination factor N-terminal domain-containing protein n=1 Tax=Klebsiella pneumoniae TaxID=573 RepID=UPI001C3CD4A7
MSEMTREELMQLARKRDIRGRSTMRKAALLEDRPAISSALRSAERPRLARLRPSRIHSSRVLSLPVVLPSLFPLPAVHRCGRLPRPAAAAPADVQSLSSR